MIQAGQPIVAADFKETSAGAGDAGKTVKLNGNGQLDKSFIRILDFNEKQYSVVENMNGSTTPIAVCINADGYIQKAEADVTNLDKFIGFCKDNITTAEIDFVNSGTSTSAPYSFVANAGNDRLLVVHVSIHKNTGAINPTGVTFNGVAMTLVNEIVAANAYANSVWVLPIGSNASNDTSKSIAVTGGTYTEIGIQALVYKNVDQSTPVLQKSEATGSSTNPNSTLDPTQAFSKILNFAIFGNGTLGSWNDGQTNRVNTDIWSGSYAVVSDVSNKNSASTSYDLTVSGVSTQWCFQAVELKRKVSTLPTSNIQFSDVLTFSGLTPNAKYYLSDTAGAISTSVGSTTILLGKALSATELLIIQS